MKPFLSELLKQLDLIKDKIQELEDAAYKGALSPRFRAKDLETARKLIKRRKDIEEKIIEYDL